MKIRLIRNSDAFSIITKTKGNFKIKVLDLRLLVRKIKPSQEIVNLHQKLFNAADAVFPFRQSKITQHLIPEGIANSQILVSSGILPKQVFSVLLKHENFIPDETKNPFKFANEGLTSFVFKLNGLQLTDRFDVDFEKEVEIFSNIARMPFVNTFELNTVWCTFQFSVYNPH